MEKYKSCSKPPTSIGPQWFLVPNKASMPSVADHGSQLFRREGGNGFRGRVVKHQGAWQPGRRKMAELHVISGRSEVCEILSTTC